MQLAVCCLLSTNEERESAAATQAWNRNGKGSGVKTGRRFGGKVSERCEYASEEEFARVFECERVGLQSLALLLTANKEAAKRCMILALRECIASHSVFKGWVLSWTRRMVIRNAISLALEPGGQSFVNTNCDEGIGSIALPPDDSLDAIAESEAVLCLPERERFVFVICVLERYSMHDCALLLGRSPRDIYETLERVVRQVGEIDEFINRPQRFAMS